MKVVVGLGNPGREYAATRHNLGFMVADAVGRAIGAAPARSRFKSDLAEGSRNGEKIILVKPQTYMNLSGHPVREVMGWYRVPRENVMVVLDDLDIPFGTIRMRADGGSGGHNGLAHIIEQLGTKQVARLRVGIGRGPSSATAQVLSRFSAAEEADLAAIVAAAAECVLAWVDDGVTLAMNRCNRKVTDNAPTATDRPA